MPVWRREEELRAEQDSKVRQEDIGEQESGFEQGIWSGKDLKKEDESQEVGKARLMKKHSGGTDRAETGNNRESGGFIYR